MPHLGQCFPAVTFYIVRIINTRQGSRLLRRHSLPYPCRLPHQLLHLRSRSWNGLRHMSLHHRGLGLNLLPHRDLPVRLGPCRLQWCPLFLRLHLVQPKERHLKCRSPRLAHPSSFTSWSISLGHLVMRRASARLGFLRLRLHLHHGPRRRLLSLHPLLEQSKVERPSL